MIFRLEIGGGVSETMFSAIAHKRLRDFLESKGRKELYSFIRSIRLKTANIYIKTEKPIVNNELKVFQEEILSIMKDLFFEFGKPSEALKIHFR